MAYEICLPYFLGRWFKQIDPEEYVNWDDWSALREKAAYLWKDTAGNIGNKNWKVFIGKHEADFKNISLQIIGKEFEKMIILLELTGHRKGWLIESRLFRFLKNMMPSDYVLAKRGLIKKSNLNVILDYVNEWLINIQYFIQFIFRVLRLFLFIGRKKNIKYFEYFWAGINSNQLNKCDDKLSFSWAVERRIFEPDKILYFLPAKSDNGLYEYYQHRKINFREPGGYFDDLGRRGAIRVLWGFIRSLIVSGGAILSSGCGYLLFRFICRSYLWCALAEYHKIKAYFTTQSSVWPERPEVAVFNAMGIKTIAWSFSANYMSYRTARPIGNDPQIALSALETKEFFVWNRLSAQWLESRLLEERKPLIRITGPVMNGDSGICLKPPEEARKEFGIRQKKGLVYVGVFDIPALSKKTRMMECLGPSPYSEEMVAAFYGDLIRISEKFSQILLILKPKYPFTDKKIVYSKSIADFYKKGKIIAMDYDIDPYIAIACSDLCIAMPFTSPVLAGIYFGRTGLYHDPLGKVNNHMYHDMDVLISHSYRELEEKIKLFLSEAGIENYKSFLKSDKMKKIMDTSEMIDPAQAFREVAKL